MIFPTLDFAVFFLIVFGVCWELRHRLELRKWFLLAASYFFYGYWDWRFLGLLALSSTINYGAGLLISNTQSRKGRGRIVFVAVLLNLTILGFFKYYGFFIESLAELLGQFGLSRDLPFLEVILPVGISFFTFQGISYVMDVSRRDVAPVKSPLDLFLYISFFPQLVAGPIVRAADFLPQLRQVPKLDRAMFAFGITLILLGLFKKMVVANFLATELADQTFFDPTAYGPLDLTVGVYAYAVQIYCDFSGYSDIAIGTAALLGYHFNINFNQPYRSRSLQEFWRRWHISLSSWLRDYLYKPLGGSRHGTLNTYRNLFLTMLLGGIWHGAKWTFVVWGIIHGVALIVERLAKSALQARKPVSVSAASVSEGARLGQGPRRGPLAAMAWIVGLLFTFHIVCLAWIFFRAENFEVAFQYVVGFAGDWSRPVELVTPFLTVLIAGSLIAQFFPNDLAERFARIIKNWPVILLGLFFGLGILLIETMGPEGVAPFIYFQF